MAAVPEYSPSNYYASWMQPALRYNAPPYQRSGPLASVNVFYNTNGNPLFSFVAHPWAEPAEPANPEPTPPPPYMKWVPPHPTPPRSSPAHGLGTRPTPPIQPPPPPPFGFESLSCDWHVLFHVIRVPPYAQYSDLFESNYVRPRFKPLRVPVWAPTDRVLKALGAGEKGWAVTEAISWVAMGSAEPSKRGAWRKGVCVKFGEKSNPPCVDGWEFHSLAAKSKRGVGEERPVWVVAHKA